MAQEDSKRPAQDKAPEKGKKGAYTVTRRYAGGYSPEQLVRALIKAHMC